MKKHPGIGQGKGGGRKPYIIERISPDGTVTTCTGMEEAGRANYVTASTIGGYISGKYKPGREMAGYTFRRANNV